MLAGESRWASARRGGMTVLGKVAVPKPINLPSQRLENHGLDPNVEIVPKGTYGWGSKSSSSTSNAWGTSFLSPNADGGSPSDLNGRPSSGGSGTRPSTAGSDRNHERIANVWVSNSRPLSASGALTSNQTSLASLRPHSSETRPGSSQLSRFAEPLPGNSVAWGASGASEKLGMSSSKNDGFSLISGDFPTLGSEREVSERNADSQDHGSRDQPSLSSGVVTAGTGRIDNSVVNVSTYGNFRSGTPTTLRKEDAIYDEDRARAGFKKWHGDPQVYPYSNIPLPHYEAWHSRPVNSHPGGIWDRGPPGGSNFSSPVAPSGFPMDPFPYYHPQMPPAAIANQQPVHSPGAGPGGPHQRDGEMFRPHVHDPYFCAGMAIRPGFYPGPVPYHAYYGPPMGYYGANERDIPLMGMTTGPTAFYGYSGQGAPDPGNPHGRSSGFGPDGKSGVSEQEEPGNPHGNHQEAQGPYKALLKQHDGWERKDERKWDESMTNSASDPGRADHPRDSSWESGWRGENKDERMHTITKGLGEEVLEAIDNLGDTALKAKGLETVGNAKSSDHWPELENADHSASTFHEMSTSSKDSSRKTGGLNAKARVSDGKLDVKSSSDREEFKNKLQVHNARNNNLTEASCVDTGSTDRTHSHGITNSASHEDYKTTVDKSLESTTAECTNAQILRRSTSGVSGRADYRGRGRLSAQETDGWWRKSQVTDRPGVISSDLESVSSVHQQGHPSVEAPEKSGPFLLEKDVESLPLVSDACDSQAQCAKMRDRALQHDQQREREEEERTRDQKAKAPAKLEELNWRTQAGEEISPNLEIGAVVNKKYVASPSLPTLVGNISRASSSTVISSGKAYEQGNESSVAGVEKPTTLSIEVMMQAPKPASVESGLLEQSKSLQQDVVHSGSSINNGTSHVPHSFAAKQNHMGYRQKLKSPLEGNPTENLISSSVPEAYKGHVGLTGKSPVSCEDAGKDIASNSKSREPVHPSSFESSTLNRKKNKSVKNKQRVEEALPAVSSLSVMSIDDPVLENVVPNGEQKTSEPLLDLGSLQSQTDSKDVPKSSEQHPSVTNEEVCTHFNNQRKSQHSRRLPRTMQANKLTEKFHRDDATVWSPLRSQNETQVSDEVSQKTALETYVPSVKIHHPVQNSQRNKRAEIERYIPRPATKEMAQQGSNHQSWIPPVSNVKTDDPSGILELGSFGAERSQTSDASVAKVGSTLELKNMEVQQNKSGKVLVSWPQRGSAELTDSNRSRNSQKSVKHHQGHKSFVTSLKEQPRYSDDWNASDGWNIPEEPTTAVVPAWKEKGMTIKGRRQSYKEHRNAGPNHDSHRRRISSEDIEKVHVQSSSSDMVQEDTSDLSKENRVAGERFTLQWQPKSHQYLATNQRGSRSSGGRDSVEPGTANKTNYRSQGMATVPHQADKEAPVVRDEKCVSEKRNLEDALSTEPQDAKKDRKEGAHKRHPVSPAESHRDWNGSVKGKKQHNVNRERQIRYEYEPVGPHTNKANDPKDGSRNSGSRFRERIQSHSRRGGGNFQVRQTSGVRVDYGYD